VASSDEIVKEYATPTPAIRQQPIPFDNS